ncbi:fluoride efflux transporter CrcB [Domibacillus indicus]|uniref:fluoride efflux transporter CrcB n=1 Tax=Domibacillus indicus TaxID=1437523 RepID=UPI000617FE91|nr:fluoride efflux transporter CrcB [Domibacillus indicus]
MIYILVGAGGMAGALLRYIVSIAIAAWWDGSFPLATLAVNYIGCFFLPLLTLRLKSRLSVPVQKAVTTGIIGSFTTFSTFSVETVSLWETGQAAAALGYVLLSIVGGLFFTRLGFKKGERLSI